MTMISALHNVSRSIGVALLLSSALGKSLAIYVIGGEMLIYLVWKVARRDFFCFYRIELKVFAVLMSFLQVSELKRPIYNIKILRSTNGIARFHLILASFALHTLLSAPDLACRREANHGL